MYNIRLAAVLLAALIFLTSPLALAEGADITIDEAFDSGRIVFRETEMDWGLKDAEIIVPERYWNVMNVDYMTDAELRTSLEVTWEDAGLPMSISPSGTLLFLEGAAALRDGRLTLLCPNPDRGVADEYGNMASYLSLQIGRGNRIGNEGVTWSPDGRYFVATNYSKIFNGDIYCFPILMDTETGDMILTAAYESSRIGGMENAMISACFSQDERYLYYILWSRGAFPKRYSLMRYELETEKTETCLSIEAEEYEICPSPLIILSDGSILSASLRLEPHCYGITRFVEKDGEWSCEFHNFLLEQSWAVGLLTDNQIIAMSRYIPWTNTNFLQVIRPNEDYAGIDEFWCIDGSTKQLIKISETDLNALIDIEQSDKDIKDKRALFKELIGKYNPAMICSIHALSPDSQYLLIENGDWFCIRLSDMTAVPVQFEQLPSSDWLDYADGYVWTDAGLLRERNGIGKSFYIVSGD